MTDGTISAWLDTIMNIEVFAFIGLLIWIYFKPDKKDPARNDPAGEDKQHRRP